MLSLNRSSFHKQTLWPVGEVIINAHMLLIEGRGMHERDVRFDLYGLLFPEIAAGILIRIKNSHLLRLIRKELVRSPLYTGRSIAAFKTFSGK